MQGKPVARFLTAHDSCTSTYATTTSVQYISLCYPGIMATSVVVVGGGRIQSLSLLGVNAAKDTQKA